MHLSQSRSCPQAFAIVMRKKPAGGHAGRFSCLRWERGGAAFAVPPFVVSLALPGLAGLQSTGWDGVSRTSRPVP
jgi:hypothetical protein